MLVAMANGAALHRDLSSKAERSWLTDGTPVRGDVAALIIARPAVVGVGDALPLFPGEIASQAWRFVGE
jgi:hypothetical protein